LLATPLVATRAAPSRRAIGAPAPAPTAPLPPPPRPPSPPVAAAAAAVVDAAAASDDTSPPPLPVALIVPRGFADNVAWHDVLLHWLLFLVAPAVGGGRGGGCEVDAGGCVATPSVHDFNAAAAPAGLPPLRMPLDAARTLLAAHGVVAQHGGGGAVVYARAARRGGTVALSAVRSPPPPALRDLLALAAWHGAR